MSLARQRDANEPAIVRALEACGCTVQVLEDHRKAGLPDLLIGCFGVDQLAEVKTDAGIVSKAQRAWHARWRGRPVIVMRSVDDALALVALLRGRRLAGGVQ